MSETPIQRWYIQNPPGQPTEFVSFTDHEAAVRAAYEQGQRGERDRIRKGVEALQCCTLGHHDESLCSVRLKQALVVIGPASQDQKGESND